MPTLEMTLILSERSAGPRAAGCWEPDHANMAPPLDFIQKKPRQVVFYLVVASILVEISCFTPDTLRIFE